MNNLQLLFLQKDDSKLVIDRTISTLLTVYERLIIFRYKSRVFQQKNTKKYNF